MKRMVIENQPSEMEINKQATFWASIIVTIAMIIFLIIFFFTLANGIEKEEKNECLEWQKQAKKINSFYLAQWQNEQCDALGIKVNAPVRQRQRR